MIILDFGSGNTCKNKISEIERMVNGLDILSHKFRENIVIKWQLFYNAGGNIPLKPKVFESAVHYALVKGYKSTASVFDRDSLLTLLKVSAFDIPFVKIANNIDLHYLQEDVPRKTPVFQSVSKLEDCFSYRQDTNKIHLCCVSKYPAGIGEYEKSFGISKLKSTSNVNIPWGISDHTTNWDLYKEYRPHTYECHYKLPDSTGLDAGEFARTPEQLLELDRFLNAEENRPGGHIIYTDV